jgi:hypothetical protein
MSDQDISSQTNYHVISGRFAGERVATRILEEQIQEAVAQGHRVLQIDAYGQHGIGGRLWQAGDEPINIQVVGQPGQRLGSMGFRPSKFWARLPMMWAGSMPDQRS